MRTWAARAGGILSPESNNWDRDIFRVVSVLTGILDVKCWTKIYWVVINSNICQILQCQVLAKLWTFELEIFPSISPYQHVSKTWVVCKDLIYIHFCFIMQTFQIPNFITNSMVFLNIQELKISQFLLIDDHVVLFLWLALYNTEYV